jgi:hypothetical protein
VSSREDAFNGKVCPPATSEAGGPELDGQDIEVSSLFPLEDTLIFADFRYRYDTPSNSAT